MGVPWELLDLIVITIKSTSISQQQFDVQMTKYELNEQHMYVLHRCYELWMKLNQSFQAFKLTSTHLINLLKRNKIYSPINSFNSLRRDRINELYRRHSRWSSHISRHIYLHPRTGPFQLFRLKAGKISNFKLGDCWPLKVQHLRSVTEFIDAGEVLWT